MCYLRIDSIKCLWCWQFGSHLTWSECFPLFLCYLEMWANENKWQYKKCLYTEKSTVGISCVGLIACTTLSNETNALEWRRCNKVEINLYACEGDWRDGDGDGPVTTLSMQWWSWRCGTGVDDYTNLRWSSFDLHCSFDNNTTTTNLKDNAIRKEASQQNFWEKENAN